MNVLAICADKVTLHMMKAYRKEMCTKIYCAPIYVHAYASFSMEYPAKS